MKEDLYRALVVDDEPLVRQLTMRALSRRGFRCEPASDGAAGAKMASSTSYDVVVTDLQMPNQHGHALAVTLLEQEQRPAIVILSGLAEPKLSKDLLARGVDDIITKPVDYEFFAAKVEAVVQRRQEYLRLLKDRAPARCSNERAVQQVKPASPADTGPRVARSDVETKLAHLSKILPVSQAAFDVFNMTSSEDFDTVVIAAATARDSSLSADILRLANSSFYNAADAKITELEEAVVRIGQKRVGDLALATTAMAGLTPSVLPWMNVDLAWRRSIAAGVAADLLLESSGNKQAESGLFLSAIMHPLGRIALAMLYPREYQWMIKECEHRGETLADQEKRVFSISHGEVLTLLLHSWGIPSSVCEPLPFVTQRYATLKTLQEPVRTKAELLKLAILIGRLVAQKWETWDSVELPSRQMVERLGIESFADLLERAKADSAAIIQFRPLATREDAGSGQANGSSGPSQELAYCSLSPEPFDFLAALLSSAGIKLTCCEPEDLELATNVVINCFGATSSRLSSLSNPHAGNARRTIVAGKENADSFASYGHVLQMPTAFSSLQSACTAIAEGK